MSILKQTSDYFEKFLLHGKRVPVELFELAQYFRNNNAINFKFRKEGEELIAMSTNFGYGTIVTSATTKKELDEKIKDAILTAFDVPSSYKKEAGISRVGQTKHEYAFA